MCCCKICASKFILSNFRQSSVLQTLTFHNPNMFSWSASILSMHNGLIYVFIYRGKVKQNKESRYSNNYGYLNEKCIGIGKSQSSAIYTRDSLTQQSKLMERMIPRRVYMFVILLCNFTYKDNVHFLCKTHLRVTSPYRHYIFLSCIIIMRERYYDYYHNKGKDVLHTQHSAQLNKGRIT